MTKLGLSSPPPSPVEDDRLVDGVEGRTGEAMVVGAEADSSSGPRMERMTGRRMRPCQRPNTTVSKNTCTQKHHPQQEYMDKKTPPSARIPAQKNTTLSKNTCTQKHHPQQEYLHTKTPPSVKISAQKNNTFSQNTCTQNTPPSARRPARFTAFTFGRNT